MLSCSLAFLVSPVPPPIVHVNGGCGRHGRGWSRGSRLTMSIIGLTQINRFDN
ncbi:MAG: hypothetical protein NTV84_03830 [Methanoregula sp.]|nr:hypothetical protein [Methanoregula sp.]